MTDVYLMYILGALLLIAFAIIAKITLDERDRERNRK